MLREEAEALVGRRAEFVGRRMTELDNHAGLVGPFVVDDVVLRDDWFCFILEGAECGGDISCLHWSEPDRRLSSRFGTYWEMVDA